jgi:predicted secreted protein
MPSKIIQFIKTILFILSIIIFYATARQYLKFNDMDDCLDRGGRYNFETSKCECEDQNYLPPMERVPIRTILFTMVISFLPSGLFFVLTRAILNRISGLPNQRFKLTE